MSDRLDRAGDFVMRNGRLLERRAFACHFDGRCWRRWSPTRIRTGDLAGAWSRTSGIPPASRVDVQVAFETFDAVAALTAETVTRACDWLETVTTAEGGVPFALPSVNGWPHAPWWTVAEPAPAACVNPTAAIVGLLLKHRIAHPWVDRASGFCWQALERSSTAEFHDVMPMISFLEPVADRPRADQALDRIAKRILQPGVVALETDAQGYMHKPLEWAPTPASFCRRLFDRR